MTELEPCLYCGSTRGPAWCPMCHAEWNRRVVTPAQVEAAAKALGAELELRHPDEREYLRNIATVAFRAAGFEVQS